jgi:hypothetical protein
VITQKAASEMERGEIEDWTLAAARAAEQGQWGRVEECYQAREAAMSGVVLSQSQGEVLLAVDRQIQAQVLVAKTAIAEQLRQLFTTRMRLKGLRSGIGVSGGEVGTLLMKA